MPTLAQGGKAYPSSKHLEELHGRPRVEVQLLKVFCPEVSRSGKMLDVRAQDGWLSALHNCVAVAQCQRTDVAWMLQDIRPSSLVLHNIMEQALANPGFLEKGATLAFACEHMYPHESKTFLKTDIQLQLKGADACLIATARGLGLAADVRSHFNVKPRSDDYEEWSDDDNEDALNDQKDGKNAEQADYLGKSFGLRYTKMGDPDGCDNYTAVQKRVELRKDLIWCRSIPPRARKPTRRSWEGSDSECDSDQGELAQVYIAYGKQALARPFSVELFCMVSLM